MKLPRKAYREAQRLGVDFAHAHTADFPIVSEGRTAEEVRLRRCMFLKGWGAALAGFKAGYYAALKRKARRSSTTKGSK